MFNRFGSDPFSINTNELLAILRGAAIAAAGAAVAFLSSAVGGLDDGTALGGLIAGAASVLVNVLRKFLADNVVTPQ